MTRVLLSILAVVEAVLGMFGLVGAANLFFSHAAGMAMLFLPVLLIAGLLVAAGAAIVLRRPWSYYVHIVALVLAGVVFFLNAGTLGGTDTTAVLLPVVVIVAGITGAFFLPPVRRYFGM